MIHNFFKLILALSILLYLSYARLFRKIYNIDFSAENLDKFTNHFIILVVLTVSLTVILSVSIYIEIFKPKGFQQRVFSFKFLYINSVINYVNDALLAVYVKLFDFGGPNIQQYLVLFAKHFINKLWLHNLLYGAIILPRCIIIITLIIEIYLGYLHYYFYSLILLIIPLMVQVLIFMLKDLSPRLYPVFLDHLVLTKVSTAKTGGFFFVDVKLKPEYSFLNLDAFMHEYFYPMLHLPGKLDVIFLPLYKKIRLITLFFYFGIQACCWGYILIFIL